MLTNVHTHTHTSSLVLFRCEKTTETVWWSKEEPAILAVTVDRAFLRAKMKEKSDLKT